MTIYDFVDKKIINKGWSNDKKYRVTTTDGTKYLLRVSPMEQYYSKKKEFEMMQRVEALGVPMCHPVEFGTCEEGVYSLQSWIDGENAEEIIHKIPDNEQYLYGHNAGGILRKIHSISAPELQEDWETRFNSKIDRKIQGYADCSIKYEKGQSFVDYINDNRYLLKNRPQCYQHGDYHLGNMMIDHNGQLQIIDFDRSDYGDPWEEFNRIVWCAQKSPLFASGMVNGYFDDDVPILFWHLLALYISSNTLSSLPWAIPFGQSEIDTMLSQANDVLQWYDNMQNPVPIWYTGLNDIDMEVLMELKLKMYFTKAKAYICKNARPLDMARWEFLFEDGCEEDVLNALAVYQNRDGGFGHALEPDCWNPGSAPMQTWVATEIIRELHIEDGEHPIIQGILDYLNSGKDFDGKVWANSVPANNDYPHAPWWHYTSEQEESYNPTACLAGFIVKYADRDSSVYTLGCRLAKESYQYFKDNYLLDSMHTVSCFTRLYAYLTEANVNELIDMAEFKDLLSRQIKEIITYDKSKWETEYVCKPSLFIDSKEDPFYEENKEIIDDECAFIIKAQKEDGTWAINWTWREYQEEWAIAKNWWKCDWIIKYLKFINQMGNDQ